MPRVKLSELDNPTNQLKDLLKDDSGLKLPPSNPYNLKWFITNFHEDVDWKEYYLNIVNDRINKKMIMHYMDGFKGLSSFRQSAADKFESFILDEKAIAERIKCLGSDGADLTSVALKSPRRKSAIIVNALFDAGLDVNYKGENNKTVLRVALDRKVQSVALAVWNNEKFNKNEAADEAAKYAIYYKMWELLLKISEDCPDIFSKPGLYGKTLIEILDNHISNSDAVKLNKKVRKVAENIFNYEFKRTNGNPSFDCKSDLINVFKEIQYNYLSKEIIRNKKDVKRNKI